MPPAVDLIKELARNKWQRRHEPLEKLENNVTVLIVDDDRESVAPLERVLLSLGCNVFFAKDGYEAIDFLSHDSEIRLVFLDWNMPEIEGGETIKLAERSISNDKKAKVIWEDRNLPVVMYTGEDPARIQPPRATHFIFIDHWPKSMGFNDLNLQVRGVLNYVLHLHH